MMVKESNCTQFFPSEARPYLVQYFTPPNDRRAVVKREILDIHLLKRREPEALFSEAQIWVGKCLA